MSKHTSKRKPLTDKQRQAIKEWHDDLRNFRSDASVTRCGFCDRPIRDPNDRYYSPHYGFGACWKCRRQYNRVKYYMRARSGEDLDRLVMLLMQEAKNNEITWQDYARVWADTTAEIESRRVEEADNLDEAYSATTAQPLARRKEGL